MTVQLPPREILSNPPPLTYGSVCSGIEAATAAWHALGWKPAFFSEIDPFPRAVLQHHYPNVPLHGDFTTIQEHDYAAIDLLVGGTPCQAFSVAGLRKGFADERGNLTLEFVRLAQRLKPRWVVWENVPGVLSIDRGRAFGSFLGGLAELGYGFAYRVLDAQHFGVPQRRRRVFVVGYLGDWRPPAAVLFERESLLGDLTPRREARESVARGAEPGAPGGCRRDGRQLSQALDGVLSKGQTMPEKGRFPAVLHPAVTHALRGEGFDASEDGTGRGTPLVPVGVILHGSSGTVSTASFAETATALKARVPGGVENSSTTVVLQSTQSSDRGLLEDAGEFVSTPGLMGRCGSHPNASVRTAVAIPINMQAAAKNGKKSPNMLGVGKDGDPAPTLGASDIHAVAFQQNTRDEVRLIGGDGQIVGALAAEAGMKQQNYVAFQTRGSNLDLDQNVTGTLGQNCDRASGGAPCVAAPMQVRRLTPRECERLQGFPGNFTLVPYRGKPAADGPRYKAIGNSMAVPCMRWIGERIELVRGVMNELHKGEAA